ncbi:PKD domain-containing protein [Methanocalculus chunghsingensis]|uniref:PKD domain-containing protein n=1 Tax=Methanocalculus chunghsingensis TaxID=156457 RepID=UPI002484C85D|nr:PKD domain-containing protein [Methanocalculus chunghsingensis]
MRVIITSLFIISLSLIISASGAGLEPVSSFSASPVSGGAAPLSVQFTDTSVGSPTNWLWLFGDGESSNLQNPVHTYTDEGIYDVTLTISNPHGQSTIKRVKYIRVGLEPTPDFIASPLVVTTPGEVRFTDLSSGSPTSWLWSFGDGSSSNEENPTYTYTEPGFYDVTLQVSNAVGTVDRIKERYIAVGSPPVPEIGASKTTGPAPLTIHFTDLSTGSPTSWLWSFGDSETSTEQNPVHTYRSAGTYTVSLMSTNLFGTEKATLQTSIQINPPVTITPTSPPSPGPGPVGPPPVANFSGSPRIGEAPLTVRFTDTSEGGATWWRWTFGDGRMSNEMSPVHTYTTPGQYTVTLAVRNDFSSSVRIEEDYIIVTGDFPAPVPPWTPAPLTPVPPGGITHTSGGAGGIHEKNESSVLPDSTDDPGRPVGSLLRSWWWVLLVLAAFTAAAYYYYTYVWKDKRDGWS